MTQPKDNGNPLIDNGSDAVNETPELGVSTGQPLIERQKMSSSTRRPVTQEGLSELLKIIISDIQDWASAQGLSPHIPPYVIFDQLYSLVHGIGIANGVLPVNTKS